MKKFLCSPVYTQQMKRVAVEIFETQSPKPTKTKAPGVASSLFLPVCASFRSILKKYESCLTIKNLKYIQQCEC